MLFTSLYFFIFFPVVFILYYLLPHRFRWMWLLIASSAFYLGFGWHYLLFFVALILLNYLLAIKIFTPDGCFRKFLYLAGILFNIFILCFFKYINWLEIDFEAVAAFFHLNYPLPFLKIILPVGLSYLVFSLLSYLIDIRRQEILPEKHPGILAVYFLFFPKLVQGPIERAGRVIPQFRREHPFDYKQVTDGLKLMTWGFFKKLVVADTLALFVNPVYDHAANMPGPLLFAGIVGFAFQLYADFSGYTDIALGSAKILGFDLMQNFRRPYLATSVRDFWTRWHISLSSWCSDYVFLPIVEHSYDLKRILRKNRFLQHLSAEKITYVLAAFATFFIIGIWHGVGWNYIMVGFLFGFYVSFDMLTKNLTKKITSFTGIARIPSFYRSFQIVVTFLLVCIVWIFFRVATVQESLIMIGNLGHGWSAAEIRNSWVFLLHLGFREHTLWIMLFATGLLVLTDILSEKKDIFLRVAEKPVYIRWAIYYLVILAIIAYGAVESRQFIYTQF